MSFARSITTSIATSVPTRAVTVALAAALAPAARRFSQALADPKRSQTRALVRIVRELKDAPRHRAIARVRTLKELQVCAPITHYGDYARDLEAGTKFGRAPWLRFEHSGGSSGAQKWIGVTRPFLRELQAALAPWLFDLYTRVAGVADGCAYWSISPLAQHARGQHAGVPVGGDDASYFPAPVRAVLSRVLAAPAELALFHDVTECRYATVLALLQRADLAMISVWSPTFLRLMLDTVHAQREQLARDLHDGTCTVADPAAVRIAVKANKARARLLTRNHELDVLLGALWPKLALVSMWTEGASGAFVDDVMRHLPGVALQPKGLIASEGVVTVPWRGHNTLAVSSHVFEFQEESKDTVPLFAHEIERDRVYRVLLTTSAGLVRYQLGDRVSVTGAQGATPTLRFIGRADIVSDLVGEKLSLQFVEAVLKAAHLRGFAMLTPRQDRKGYVLFVDADSSMSAAAAAARVEQALCAGHPYRYARALGQLDSMRCVAVHAPERWYEQRCVQRGQRAGDVKPMALRLELDWDTQAHHQGTTP